MSSLRSIASALALNVTVVVAVGGCSAGGVSRPAGFSTAYAPAAGDASVTDDASDDASAPDGDAGPTLPAGPILRSIAGSGAGSAWTVGDVGAAVHLGGNTFTPVATGIPVSLGGLNVLDVVHAFAVERGGAQVFAWGGASWAPLGAPRADRAAAATFAASGKDVWVAGNGVDRWNGTTWTQEIPSGAMFTSIAGSFDTDVWAVGPGGAQHWDGKTWSAIATPTDAGALSAVWVGGLFDAWVVGAAGTVLHWSGSTFTRITTPTTKNLTSISGNDTFDIWVGGQDGLLLHWDGNTWTEYTSPAGRTIESLWTARGGDLFFVDGASTISRFAR